MNEKNTYVTLIENEPYSVKCPHEMEWACCDCGLVHTIMFKIIEKKYLYFKLKRNDRSTAQIRRYRKAGLFKNCGKWKIIRNKKRSEVN